MRQASETMRCYKPMTIITPLWTLLAIPCRAADKAHSYAKVIKEMNWGCGPKDAILHVDRKHLNNRIEGDHGALKQLVACDFAV